MLRKGLPYLALGQALGLSIAGSLPAQDIAAANRSGQQGPPEADSSVHGSRDATDRLVASLEDPRLRALAAEVLGRNPDVARSVWAAEVAEARAPQVSALPDPVAAVSLFVLPPETRAGAQRLSGSIQQKLPWFGKLATREKAALLAAAAARADAETIRLDVLTEARRLVHELAFLRSYESVVQTERQTLVRYEKAAQARYAAGIGLRQGIVRIQAQITRTDTRLLEIVERRSSLISQLNRLRDRPASAPIDGLRSNDPPQPDLDEARLQELARAHRPELAAVDARLAEAGALVTLAEKGFRPDVTLGASYTVVERRDDAAARLSRPDDDGDDVFALTGSVNLPIRRRKLEAGLEQAHATRRVAEEHKRSVLSGIESTIGDLATRMPLLSEHLSLLETVLVRQAREALRSAETAYSTGQLNAVDLLDAEVVLLEVQIAAARTKADLAVAWAELERAVAHPVAGSSGDLRP